MSVLLTEGTETLKKERKKERKLERKKEREKANIYTSLNVQAYSAERLSG
jgi:hypothetical protein